MLNHELLTAIKESLIPGKDLFIFQKYFGMIQKYVLFDLVTYEKTTS